jgi:hypothetical protein
LKELKQGKRVQQIFALSGTQSCIDLSLFEELEHWHVKNTLLGANVLMLMVKKLVQPRA